MKKGIYMYIQFIRLWKPAKVMRFRNVMLDVSMLNSELFNWPVYLSTQVLSPQKLRGSCQKKIWAFCRTLMTWAGNGGRCLFLWGVCEEQNQEQNQEQLLPLGSGGSRLISLSPGRCFHAVIRQRRSNLKQQKLKNFGCFYRFDFLGPPTPLNFFWKSVLIV